MGVYLTGEDESPLNRNILNKIEFITRQTHFQFHHSMTQFLTFCISLWQVKKIKEKYYIEDECGLNLVIGIILYHLYSARGMYADLPGNINELAYYLFQELGGQGSLGIKNFYQDLHA